MGSPSAVPVPCISRPSTSKAPDGEPPARCCWRMAACITRCCAGPLGAVRELERPLLSAQHHGLDGLSAHVPVSESVQRLAPPVRSQHAGAVDGSGGVRSEDEVHTAHQGGVALLVR
eukprot:7672142-Pyramimonas_sp.AAC.1